MRKFQQQWRRWKQSKFIQSFKFFCIIVNIKTIKIDERIVKRIRKIIKNLIILNIIIKTIIINDVKKVTRSLKIIIIVIAIN